MMMLSYFRLFKYDGISLTDYSLLNQDSSTITPVLTASDYFYVAQEFPSNNFFAYVNTVNATAATLATQYWNGKEWVDAVDILDGTSSVGATFGQSGVVQFSPDDDQGWVSISDTSDSTAPSELQGIKLYDLYWYRVSPSVDLDAGLTLKELGYSFTTSDQLSTVDVEINNFFNAFESGKTDWIPEIMTASKMMIMDLKRLGIIVHAGNILRFDDLSMACTYKTLELIYMNLGPSYNDKKVELRKLYTDALNVNRFTIDKDKDGLVDAGEIRAQMRRLIR